MFSHTTAVMPFSLCGHLKKYSACYAPSEIIYHLFNIMHSKYSLLATICTIMRSKMCYRHSDTENIFI